ncbi:MAG TPA: ATP-binding protein [Vicinamibacterales bacterium]|nr:ATP-binding protein [Vicinamibacterales bacterium]
MQEALTNCVRHARATCIHVRVIGNADQLHVTVTDDGVGMDSARRRHGLGLRGIEERVRELDGVMTIASAIGKGTSLEIRLPMLTPVSTEGMSLARAAGR